MSFPLGAARPILLRSVAATTTIALIHSATPATRYAAAWLPLAHLTALYLVLGPLQASIHRPGGTFSVSSWLSGAVATWTLTAGVMAGEEARGWRDVVVIGGFVAVMNYAAVRVFVGLDPSSAIALLSLAIPVSFISSKSGTANAHLTPIFLLSLAASSTAVVLSTATGITTLHSRTYSFLFSFVYLGCTYYSRQVTGTNPVLATVKTMRDSKAALVAFAGSALLVMMFAVNGKERLVPYPKSLPLLLLSAVLFVGGTISTLSSTSNNNGRKLSASDDTMDSETSVEWTSTSSALATSSLTLLLTAVVQGCSPSSILPAPTSVLFSQAFVFLAATVAASILPSSLPGMEQQQSRNGSYSSLADVSGGAGKGYAELEERNMDVVVSDGARDVEAGVMSREGSNGDAKLNDSDATITAHFGSAKWNANKDGWVKRACWALFLLPLVAWIGTTTRAALAPLDGVVLGGEVGVKGYGVVAYYHEDVAILRNTIQTVKRKIRAYHTTKVIVYAKGPAHTANGGDREAMHRLRRDVGADEVVALKNVGREGETYLNHITRHYDSLTSPLGRQTLFIQPHLAWDWMFLPRMNNVLTDETGFVSFGPYLNASCTKDGGEIDSHGQSHPRIAQIYSSFHGDLCPADGFSITWAGQFMASRKRIWGNKKSTYANLLEFFHVPKLAEDDAAYATTRKEWIWKEGW
ncbi:hypothetical protein QFC21_002199 [Naganishia friedmannii]|uniref:Uncharacterized protein n=1 Tax=Naganishia friedmannii TaxID=89922 RepID=A0ACC2VXN0_9TREE|nr:hypothetical protein QFC21_002199 [Naganishia friedmannii]